MRVNPVTAVGRANVRRKRASVGETETERQSDFGTYLPSPEAPDLSKEQDAFVAHYHPNSVFMAHLIATRDAETDIRSAQRATTSAGIDAYKAMAAMPRRRATGHVLQTER